MKTIAGSVGFVVALLASTGANAAGSLLRVTCDGGNAGAEVFIDGKFKGECPVDIQIEEGQHKLRAVKTVDDAREQVFEQDIRMGDGVVKKVEAVLSAPQLTAEGEKREEQRLAAELEERLRAEAKARAEFDAVLAALRQQGVELGNDKTFRDCADCPEMVVIPAGNFTMGSPENEPGRPEKSPRIGVTLAMEGNSGGVIIDGVELDFPAAKAGLLKGDKVLKIDSKEIKSSSEFVEEIKRKTKGGNARLLVERDNLSFEIFVEVAEMDFEQQHSVKLGKVFALGKTHITKGQFAAFVNETGYDAGKKCYVFDEEWKERSRSWRNPGYAQQDNHPVACINWNDAQAYADWLAKKTGKPYRLPTEAEWEYAARAGTTSARYWGDSPDQACGYANVADQTTKSQISGWKYSVHNCTDGYAYTSPIGSFKPNAFGLYDMQGNLWQWTADSYHGSYSGAPGDGSAWQGDGAKRVLRGGSWINDPQFARAALRREGGAAHRSSNSGFRLARTLP